MVSVRQLVAYLAVAATAGLGANARGVDADAARAVEATTDAIADVVAPKHGITVLAHEDLESGCGPPGPPATIHGKLNSYTREVEGPGTFPDPG